MCNCKHLIKTENKMVTKTGITYIVFICENCKKYYVKRFNFFYEVQHNENEWTQTGEKIKA